MPQATEQYGQVLRVSVARVSLYSRTSASASPGEKPMSAKLEPTSDMPVTFKNWRLVSLDMNTLPHAVTRRSVGSRVRSVDPRFEHFKLQPQGKFLGVSGSKRGSVGHELFER